MSSEWILPDETPETLRIQRYIFAGLILGAVAYGVHATLFFSTLVSLWPKREHSKERFFIGYIVVVFILSSVANATGTVSAQYMYVDYRGYPGGSLAFFFEQSSMPITAANNSLYIVLTWFQDALLVYRFWIIFNRSILLMILPCIGYLGILVLSCILIAMFSNPANTFFGPLAMPLLVSYWSLSIALNVIVTLCIVGRLLTMRFKHRHVLGTDNPYVSVSAMLIESAFLWSALGLIFLVPFARNSPIQNIFLPMLGQVQSIAPLLIILRVAQGRAWSKSTSTVAISEISFDAKHSNNESNATGRSRSTGTVGTRTIVATKGYQAEKDIEFSVFNVTAPEGAV